MAMNNERRATGSGFKLSPGSKEKHSEGTFRMDSPMKQLGFASPMRQTDDKKKKMIKGKEYSSSNRRPGETGQQFFDRVQKEKKSGKTSTPKKKYVQSEAGKAKYAKMSASEKKQRLKDAEARKNNRVAKMQAAKAEKSRSARAAKGHDVGYANRSFRKNTAEGRAIDRDVKKGKYKTKR